MARSDCNGCAWKSVLAGAAGGLLGAFAMNQFQALVSAISKRVSDANDGGKSEQENSSQDEDATVKTAEAISRHVFGHELQKDEKKWAGPLVHYGLGTSLGATYGALADSLPTLSAGLGTAYGTAVWLLADEVAVPSFGLAPPATDTPLSSHVNALASHLVFGFVTGLTRRLLIGSRTEF